MRLEMWVWLGWRGCGCVQNDIIGWLHGEGGSHLWKWVFISFTTCFKSNLTVIMHSHRLIYASNYSFRRKVLYACISF